MTAPGAMQPEGFINEGQTLDRLLELRQQLLNEQDGATSPAVARALEMADTYLFLAISYLGYTDHLFPEER